MTKCKTSIFVSDSMQLEAKISFCSLPEQRVTCRVNDPVLVTKGQGQFSFQLETPPLCDCRRPLIAKSSWQDGVYNYIQYGCGQVTFHLLKYGNSVFMLGKHWMITLIKYVQVATYVHHGHDVCLKICFSILPILRSIHAISSGQWFIIWHVVRLWVHKPFNVYYECPLEFWKKYHFYVNLPLM